MAIEYLGLSSINGPLIALEGVQDAFYDEIVDFVVNGKEHKTFRPLLLGPGQEPCLRKTFSGDPLADQLQRVSDRSRRLVPRQCITQIR